MMRHLNRLPIWRDANQLLVAIELAVRGFARYHKYTVGVELRNTCLRVCQAVHRGYSRRRSQHKMVQQVVELIDDLKIQIQLAKELHAFANFSQFQRVAELAVSVGKQEGGLNKLGQKWRATIARHATQFTVRPLHLVIAKASD